MIVCQGMVALIPDLAFGKYIQLDGVADVKTKYSIGCANVQEAATMAEQAGLDIVIFNDQVRNSIQYGIFPLKRLIKKTIEGPSILSTSAGVYLSNIHDKNKQYRETILIPGADVSPFYYWTGGVLKKNLIAHNWDKRLSIIGLQYGEDFEQLPILDSNFSTNYSAKFQNSVLGFGLLFAVAVAMVFRGYYRKATVPLAILFMLLIFNNHPFRSSLYDQYHGDRGINPYQEVIDYAVSKGAMVFWDDVEAVNGQREWGTINLETLPHPEDLVLSRNYTGFQAVADEPVSITEPGNVWDHVLVQYLRGERNHPVWGYGANNFQCAGESGPILGAVRTIFLVREKQKEAVMDAMRKGRMYAVRQPGPHRLSLDEFVVKDVATGKKSTMGEQLVSTDFPEITFKVHSTDGNEKRAKVFLIRNGKVIKRESVVLPYELTMIDSQVDMTEPVYYRLNVIVSSVDHLVSNPVFVKFGKTASVASTVASLETERSVLTEPDQPQTETPAPPKAPEPRETENPQVAKLEPPEPPAVKELAPPVPPPAPVTVPAPGQPAKIETPLAPVAKSPPPAGGEKYVRVLIDGVTLKKGPGAVFSEIGKANKGDRLLLVRRTKVVFNDKVWLVVKSGDQLAYVWEGLVKEE
ncbi:MAG: hypothetical protein NPINA01_01750 [Nitrospinaceae bacterium]|nr:MAG: hypothetical protein NPINA01_01750 [Nitrospinaceae bacterium]